MLAMMSTENSHGLLQRLRYKTIGQILVLLLLSAFMIAILLSRAPISTTVAPKAVTAVQPIHAIDPKPKHEPILATTTSPKTPINIKTKAPQLTPPTALYQTTDLIGSADHPTIDGGIINATDGLLIHHVVIQEAVTPSPAPLATAATKDLSGAAVNHKRSPSNTTDSWINNQTVTRILNQAARDGHLNYVLRKINAMDLPASLALVPLVESDYHNHAVSAKGAAGAWQLMPELAKDYGLHDDERFQFEPATDVALRFLKELHQQFGSWELALAAYNAGPARVSKALKQNPQATSVQELALPSETQRYVKQIKAAQQLLLTSASNHAS